MPAEPPPTGNYFLRRGACWAVRFGDGGEKIHTPDIGFEYLHALLGHPDREFSAAKLATRVRAGRNPRGTATGVAPAGEVPVTPGPGADDILDDEAVRAYLVRMTELDEGIRVAEANPTEVGTEALEELVAERRRLAAELGRSRGLRGRKRKLGAEERELVRKRVCNAVTRARDRIKVYDDALAEHLARPGLTMGHHLRYTPRGGITWVRDA